MRKNKLLMPSIYAGILVVAAVSIIILVTGIKNYAEDKNNLKYTLDNYFEETIVPVVNTKSNSIIRPYLAEEVKVGRTFYDISSTEKEQEKSLILYGDTYIQNNGVDYISKETFDVIAVLEGEVVSIEDSDVYGKIVTIKHNDNLNTIYSNISDITINIGYQVSQGEIIATSKKSYENDDELLHFEVTYKGDYIDPETLYTLSVTDLE